VSVFHPESGRNLLGQKNVSSTRKRGCLIVPGTMPPEQLLCATNFVRHSGRPAIRVRPRR
jgi:hypothetical protein